MTTTVPDNGHKQAKETVGAVLVVGAGIGGMQASLDLAEAGLKVYLLENSPAIGGTMAQLDKTFPTNDCAMCIMSPKLVEVGRHLNIDILTTAVLEEVSGEPGNFGPGSGQRRAMSISKPAPAAATALTACPVPRSDLFNGGLSERRAIYKPYPQAIPNAYAIEKEGVAPCRDACPINQRAQGYVALVRRRPLCRRLPHHQRRQPLPVGVRAGLQPPLRRSLLARQAEDARSTSWPSNAS
jgi:heterodisulfide reductase subunit A-like polyferredoxin